MTAKIKLIKLGGSILNDVLLMAQMGRELKLLHDQGIRLVVVHGGSKAIASALKQYGIASHFQQGLRVTSLAAMQVIEMVLSGQVNQQLVRSWQALGLPAVGLSGCDGGLLAGDYLDPSLGCVGKINQVNIDLIEHLLAQTPGYVPVIAPIGCSPTGEALNINADFAAAHLARALSVNELIYLTDIAGIYDSQQQLINELNLTQLTALMASGVVSAGMYAKAQAIVEALTAGLKTVNILAAKPGAILNQIAGTACYA